MDDPTRRCENDTGIEARLPGLSFPSGSRSFFCISQPIELQGFEPIPQPASVCLKMKWGVAPCRFLAGLSGRI